MSELYTIDASVFVSAFNSYETDHKESHYLLERLQALRVSLIEPTLLLPELAATLSRIYRDEEMALDFSDGIRNLANLSLVPLDESLTELTVNVAARHRLRGSDSVYVAVAHKYGATLVTPDREQFTRGSEVVPTQTPSEAISGTEA